jgi:hypothetical protein
MQTVVHVMGGLLTLLPHRPASRGELDVVAAGSRGDTGADLTFMRGGIFGRSVVVGEFFGS